MNCMIINYFDHWTLKDIRFDGCWSIRLLSWIIFVLSSRLTVLDYTGLYYWHCCFFSCRFWMFSTEREWHWTQVIKFTHLKSQFISDQSCHRQSTWHLASGIWHLAPGTWLLISDIWYLISDIWFLISDMWFPIPSQWQLDVRSKSLIIYDRIHSTHATSALLSDNTITSSPSSVKEM
jgi:hypothetical protein